MNYVKELEKARQELELEKQKLLGERELIRLRNEIDTLKKETEQPSRLKGFGVTYLRGIKRIGNSLGKIAIKAGEGLSKADSSAIVGGSNKQKGGKE